jgi:hypothetical protein
MLLLNNMIKIDPFFTVFKLTYFRVEGERMKSLLKLYKIVKCIYIKRKYN